MELVAGPLREDSASRRKQMEDLPHSNVKGAVGVEIKLICAALLCHLGGPMSRDKGPCTKGACRLHGMVPYSIMEGAVAAESKYICAALQCHVGGPLPLSTPLRRLPPCSPSPCSRPPSATR